MKFTTLLPLVLIVLSLTCAAIAASDPDPVPVLDVDGNELQVGVPYEMWGSGTGLGPISIDDGTGSEPCPENVVQVPFNAPPAPLAIPVTFWPANTSETVVRNGTDINIVFSCLTDCPSNVWMVHPYDRTPEQFFITTGGQLGNPGCGTINNWFQIVAVEDTSRYKLIVDPQVCYTSGMATDVTVVEQSTQNRLRLNVDHDPDKSPVEVRFYKKSGDQVRSDH